MELRESCEYCKFYEYDYDYKCVNCRVASWFSEYSQFEIADELVKWKESEE